MPCYRPLKAFRSKTVNPKTGRRSLVFNERDSHHAMIPLEIPCGRCIGCKLERSRQWAMRCVHEASLFEENCVVTLTYDPEHLPEDGSVNVEHFQGFMKRLRTYYKRKFNKTNIRFMHCGEYGDKGGRPHYHACLFNMDFPDKIYVEDSKKGDRLFSSAILQELWPYGLCRVGSLTFESAAYIARYITKKVTGPAAEDHYQGRKPEYITMSRRPGIGKQWFDKYKSDVYPDDFVIMNGQKVGVPKFYDNQLPEEELKQYKLKRKYRAYDNRENNTFRRLHDRETIKLSQTQLLKRNFEND